MRQTSLSKWLKAMIIGVGLCGLVVYAVVIPALGQQLAWMEDGAYEHCYWPWLLFIWGTGLPCAGALALAWRIAGNIGADRSFSVENAGMLKWISLLAAGDAALFFLGNLVFLVLDMNHPAVVLASLLVVFAGFAIAVASAALSHLVRKAADLQEQSDWTI